ncbi:HK97 family phage prohead protease [Antarcticimicrobium luteum]|uniref:HK97 family phage prohead protease n=1 Tax=Antarcticimicrobium luteum TaxID=2547397 RepID=A0A4R5VDJ7_9RHOB|nr:HK97 family phage prohead protease [Antarcticimicrobium luteum]TDK49835.1 HK97 family phage prohead protease [Antarcticimicrobium luteum]
MEQGRSLETGLETKFARFGDGLQVSDEAEIAGYASLFDRPDQSGDVVARGAYSAALRAMAAQGRTVKLLWQHDPAQPIGVWEELREDERGLWVKGRLLQGTQRGREAAALVAAGALDGLSIGYRTRRAERRAEGGRLLTELELWEVSLVTFPMLSGARVAAKGAGADSTLRELAAVLRDARHELAQRERAKIKPENRTSR